MLHARSDYTKRIIDLEGLIPKDEPVFLIRGQDIFAENILTKYVRLLEESNGDPELIEQIKKHINLIKNYPIKKMPDLPDDYELLNNEDMNKIIDEAVHKGNLSGTAKLKNKFKT